MVQQSKKAEWKITKKDYYFIDLKNPLKPKVLRDSYFHRLEAKSCFEKYLHDEKRYFMIRGDALMPYTDECEPIKPPYWLHGVKLDRRKIPVFSQPNSHQLSQINRRILRKKKMEYLNITIPPQVYNYPEDCVTLRQKKTFREMQRRRFYRQFKHIY